jgi:hypothetical protein
MFYVLYLILKPRINPEDSVIQMPVLKPIPIPTLKQPSPIHKLTVFIFEVRKWEVVEDWHYTYKSDKNVELLIPKGFVFDGASIPRPFWYWAPAIRQSEKKHTKSKFLALLKIKWVSNLHLF